VTQLEMDAQRVREARQLDVACQNIIMAQIERERVRR